MEGWRRVRTRTVDAVRLGSADVDPLLRRPGRARLLVDRRRPDDADVPRARGGGAGLDRRPGPVSAGARAGDGARRAGRRPPAARPAQPRLRGDRSRALACRISSYRTRCRARRSRSSPFAEARGWREIALWWPAEKTLVVAEAVGTNPFFTGGRDPVGVHLLLRLTPPRAALGPFEPEHLLVGHGEGVHGAEASTALGTALAGARTGLVHLVPRIPAFAVDAYRRRR